ncbi:MAG: YidC/Oxa1 family membrane protein insertase [Actinomycetota bacterium]
MNIWEQFVGYFKTAVTSIADVYSFLGDYRWAAAIITMTIIVRSLLLPLAIKQIRSMREQQRLQPEVARLRQKYKSDRQKMTQEMMALYQREGVNPYAACLPMVAQMPVFIAMYYSIRELKPTGGMPFLLVDLTDKASGSVGGWLLIVIMTAAQLLSTRQLNPGQTDQQRRLQMLMPLMFVFLFINFPAALVLYWATQSTYQLVQQIIMTRDMRVGQPWWRPLWPFGSPSRDPSKPAKTKVVQRVPDVPEPALAAGPTSGFDVAQQRRDIAEKRARRRRKKKKRRR